MEFGVNLKLENKQFRTLLFPILNVINQIDLSSTPYGPAAVIGEGKYGWNSHNFFLYWHYQLAVPTSETGRFWNNVLPSGLKITWIVNWWKTSTNITKCRNLAYFLATRYQLFFHSCVENINMHQNDCKIFFCTYKSVPFRPSHCFGYTFILIIYRTDWWQNVFANLQILSVHNWNCIFLGEMIMPRMTFTWA